MNAVQTLIETLDSCLQSNGFAGLECRQLNVPRLLKAIADVRAEIATPAQDAAATAPHGWMLVPVEPTAKMCKAAADAWLDCGSRMVLNKAGAAVRAGIKAAPLPEPQAAPTTPQAPALVPLTDAEGAGDFKRAVIELLSHIEGDVSEDAKTMRLWGAVTRHYSTPTGTTPKEQQ